MSKLKDHLINVKKNDIKHAIFKNVIPVNYEWQLFLDYIEESKKIGNYRSDCPGFYILNSTEEQYIDGWFHATDFEKQCTEAYGDSIPMHGFSVIVSETARGDIDTPTGVTKHTDYDDTIHLHCIGNSVWTLWNEDGSSVEYYTEPGDVVYAESGVFHQVESITPRAGIVFVAGKGGY